MNHSFANLKEFYAFYLTQHQKPGTRLLHCIGTCGFVLSIFLAVILQKFVIIFDGVVFAYGLAWLSHFFIERNRPATFRYPLRSLVCDFWMCFDVLRKGIFK